MKILLYRSLCNLLLGVLNTRMPCYFSISHSVHNSLPPGFGDLPASKLSQIDFCAVPHRKKRARDWNKNSRKLIFCQRHTAKNAHAMREAKLPPEKLLQIKNAESLT